MSQSEHTPGPWHVGAQNDISFVIDKPPRPSNDDINPDHDVTVIAKVYQVAGGYDEEAANARLLAAAPDLLQACRELINYELGMRGGLSVCVRMAQAAIARAEGGAK